MNESHLEHEALVRKLLDDETRVSYEGQYSSYKTCLSATILGKLLILAGTLMYGSKPSYGKFKAIEIIARIPYQSWESAAYTLVSAFHEDEHHAVQLSKTSAFARAAQDNETMHVVVISQLAKLHKQTGLFRFTLLPVLFAFVYFWVVYVLYFLSRRATYELNYLFESHAYQQYDEFIAQNKEHLQNHPVDSSFLRFYGREVGDELELFQTIRNDELIHRNRSITEVQKFFAH